MYFGDDHVEDFDREWSFKWGLAHQHMSYYGKDDDKGNENSQA
jgi:hypothetical protein